MTKRTRRKIDSAVNAEITLAAVREEPIMADLVRQYQAHPDR